jgi:putative membrane protein
MASWPLDPTVYLGLVVVLLGYGALARGRKPFRFHGLFFGAGMLCVWLALETPIDTISDRYLDSIHMVQHVLLGVVAPPLFLLGLSPPMAAAVTRVPGVRALTEPIPAQVIAAAVMIGWHLPVLYEATLHSEPVHVVEHLMFIAGGLVLWWPVLAATSQQAAWVLGAGGKLVYILVATFAQDAVALALQFSRVPFYEFYTHAPRLIPALDPLTDQTLAGSILMFAGKTSFVVAALVIFFRWFGAEGRTASEPEPS